MGSSKIEEVLAAWQPYVSSIENWQELVKGVTSKPTGCGPVYELTNPIDRPNESFAIADMRGIEYAEPHYHTNGEIEIYIVISGLGKVVVGGEVSDLNPGTVSLTPPDTAHYVIPKKDLVLAVINTPPFDVANAVTVTQSNPKVKFNAEQFEQLKQAA